MRIARWLAAAAPVGFLALFYFWPLFALLRLSFAAAGPLDLSALREVASDPYYRDVFAFTVAEAAASTVLTLAAGIPAAYVFARYGFRFKSLLRALATLPIVMPVVVAASAFSALIGPRGLFNNLLMAVLARDTPVIELQYSLALMLVSHVFFNYALVLRILGAYWTNLDPQYERAAAVLGANRLQIFGRITIPLAAPALGASALLVFIFCFSAFGTVLLLAGPRYATIEVEIYTQVAAFLNLPVAAALSVVQIGVTAMLTWAYVRVQSRSPVTLQFRPERDVTARPESKSARILVLFVMLTIVVLIGLPLLALTLRWLGAVVDLSGRPLAQLFERPAAGTFPVAPIEALRNSLVFAVLATALALLVGLPAAYVITDRRADRLSRATRAVLDPVLMLPLGTSAVTLGLGYLVAFGSPPLDLRSSPAMVPLVHAMIALPLVVRSLVPSLRSLDPRLRQAAAVLGAGPFTAWRLVELPILSRGLAVAATFAFTVSMGEFGASLLIVRPEFPTLPVAIYRYLGQPGLANYAMALTMSVLLLGVTVAAFVLIERVRFGGLPEF